MEKHHDFYQRCLDLEQTNEALQAENATLQNRSQHLTRREVPPKTK